MQAGEQGGLSGAPLTQKACALIRHIRRETKSVLPLIGVGGIMTAQDGVDRIRAGASLIPLYSGLVYAGFKLVSDINKALIEEVRREGMSSVEELVGIDI